MLTRNDVSVINEFYCNSNLQDVEFDFGYCKADVDILYCHSSKTLAVPYSDFMGLVTNLNSEIDDSSFLKEFGIDDYDLRFSKLAYINNNFVEDDCGLFFEEVSKLLDIFEIVLAKSPADYHLIFPKGKVIKLEHEEFRDIIHNHVGDWITYDSNTDIYDALYTSWEHGKVKITSLVRRLYTDSAFDMIGEIELFIDNSKLTDVWVEYCEGNSFIVHYNHYTKEVEVEAETLYRVITSSEATINDGEFLKKLGIDDYLEVCTAYKIIKLKYKNNNLSKLFPEIKEMFRLIDIGFYGDSSFCWLDFKNGKILRIETKIFKDIFINSLGYELGFYLHKDMYKSLKVWCDHYINLRAKERV
jgi:hypothetical protein